MISGLPFTIYDLMGFGFILLLALIIGFWGIVGLITGIGAWVGAAIITLYFYEDFQSFAQIWLNKGLMSDLSAAAGGFAFTLAILMLIGTLISQRIKTSILGPVNRALGFATGGALGFALLSVAMVILILVGGDNRLPESLKQSRSYGLYANSGIVILSLVPESFKSNAMRELELRREQAEDAYDAFHLYQQYVAPKPRNQRGQQNNPDRPTQTDNSTQDEPASILDDFGISQEDKENLDALIKHLP